MHHKEVWKQKFKLVFSFRPILGREGLISLKLEIIPVFFEYSFFLGNNSSIADLVSINSVPANNTRSIWFANTSEKLQSNC